MLWYEPSALKFTSAFIYSFAVVMDPEAIRSADSVPVVMLPAFNFETVSLLQSSVPVWIFDAVSRPVMIFPLEMMVVSQLEAPTELRVARVPCPAIAAAVCVDV